MIFIPDIDTHIGFIRGIQDIGSMMDVIQAVDRKLPFILVLAPSEKHLPIFNT